MDTHFTVSVGGHEVRARFKPVNNNLRMKLDDYVGPAIMRGGRGEYQPGMAQGSVLVSCIDKLYVDDKEVTVSKLGNLNDYYDDEKEMDLQEILLREIVNDPRNKILLRRYRAVFEEYLPDLDDEFDTVGLDPTE